MALPSAITEYLNENAQREGQSAPTGDDDLFKLGILDSFALIDFVTLLEEHCEIKVPDGDVNPANFQSVAQIERYIQKKKG
jgi:acyl carrier protein